MLSWHAEHRFGRAGGLCGGAGADRERGAATQIVMAKLGAKAIGRGGKCVGLAGIGGQAFFAALIRAGGAHVGRDQRRAGDCGGAGGADGQSPLRACSCRIKIIWQDRGQVAARVDHGTAGVRFCLGQVCWCCRCC